MYSYTVLHLGFESQALSFTVQAPIHSAIDTLPVRKHDSEKRVIELSNLHEVPEDSPSFTVVLSTDCEECITEEVWQA